MHPSLSAAELGVIKLPPQPSRPRAVVPFGGPIGAWGSPSKMQDGGGTQLPSAARAVAPMDVPHRNPPSQKGNVQLMLPSRTDTRGSTPFTDLSVSRPFTPGALPALPAASGSPYDDDRKLRREVITLRKRVKELEQQVTDLNTSRKPIDVTVRQRQIDSAYGVVRPGAMPPLDGSGAGGETSEYAPPNELDLKLEQVQREWQAKLRELTDQYERRVADGDREKETTLSQLRVMKTQVSALSGSLEESSARFSKREREAREKERQARVDLLHRQAGRRIRNQGIMFGFSAWAEYCHARAYAFGKLRECANRLRKGTAEAFYGWLCVTPLMTPDGPDDLSVMTIDCLLRLPSF